MVNPELPNLTTLFHRLALGSAPFFHQHPASTTTSPSSITTTPHEAHLHVFWQLVCLSHFAAGILLRSGLVEFQRESCSNSTTLGNHCFSRSLRSGNPAKILTFLIAAGILLQLDNLRSFCFPRSLRSGNPAKILTF
jgi:hypothetical protein